MQCPFEDRVIQRQGHQVSPPPHAGHIDSRAFGYTLLAAIPVILAGLIVWQHRHANPAPAPALKTVQLIPIKPPSAEALENIFSSEDYSWPPQDSIPPYAIESLPYGLDTLNKDEKKTVFFRALLPIVVAENLRIWNQRVFLLEQFGQGAVDPQSDGGEEVAAIAADYKITGDLNDPEVRDTLLRRVDVVPVALVLAQAAQESGWGTSRFALEANNLFGMWTWDTDAGAVPLSRPADATHLVRVYPDIQTSVRAYLHTINIGFAYVNFRNLRAQMRTQGQALNAFELAGSLEQYSITGAAYITNLRSMLRSSELSKLDRVSLAPIED